MKTIFLVLSFVAASLALKRQVLNETFRLQNRYYTLHMLNFGIKFCKMKGRNFVFIHGQREINSGIHKAAGLTVHGGSMICLVLFHCSTIPTVKSSMGERPLGVVPTGGFSGNGW